MLGYCADESESSLSARSTREQQAVVNEPPCRALGTGARIPSPQPPFVGAAGVLFWTLDACVLGPCPQSRFVAMCGCDRGLREVFFWGLEVPARAGSIPALNLSAKDPITPRRRFISNTTEDDCGSCTQRRRPGFRGADDRRQNQIL